jgi:hypothetical protein
MKEAKPKICICNNPKYLTDGTKNHCGYCGGRFGIATVYGNEFNRFLWAYNKSIEKRMWKYFKKLFRRGEDRIDIDDLIGKQIRRELNY